MRSVTWRRGIRRRRRGQRHYTFEQGRYFLERTLKRVVLWVLLPLLAGLLVVLWRVG